MNVEYLREWAADKERFQTIGGYVEFARAFCEFRSSSGFQAELVARNNPSYRFLQYKSEADYQLTRPINASLFYTADTFDVAVVLFREALEMVRDGAEHSDEHRDAINRTIYTLQQAIGASLDALPAARSNVARKVNGDLFERLIGLTIESCGIDCRSGVLTIPVKDADGEELFGMKYQHDLMVEVEGDLKAIGSVKTSSKDRLDKVFIDKFLYNRLTGVSTPHFAIFLHDVQRAGREPNFRTSNTFLPGHFKGYTVKLNPLDGVYYCDLLPQMETDPLLAAHIDRIDKFYVEDLPRFINQAPPSEAEVKGEGPVEATD
ncbi:MAG: hypothetical protein E7L06_08210 [Schaalia turicensis]|uniref:hypothetical protein n=1 Tax=Varibaculum cambriense TaxID=184870 RepID=UPI00241CD5D7|nr:hypothetical protein [Varibaculum cambriense]MBS5973196.1 hypothetical protein [Varibaculum cambriense]MDU7384073.1 hypothetical protein [Schaalia turicensis]